MLDYIEDWPCAGDRAILGVSWLPSSIWHWLLPIQWSPQDASARRHFFILLMGSLWIKSDVWVHARVRYVSVSIFVGYSETPLRVCSSTVCDRDLNVILEVLESHLVPKIYRIVSIFVQWAYADGYLTWFYKVSHSIMTPNVLGRSPRSSNHEVLKYMDDHAEDKSVVYRCIIDMGGSSIDVWLFEEGSP